MMSLLKIALCVTTFWCGLSLAESSACAQKNEQGECNASDDNTQQTSGIGMMQKKRSLERLTLEENAEAAAPLTSSVPADDKYQLAHPGMFCEPWTQYSMATAYDQRGCSEQCDGDPTCTQFWVCRGVDKRCGICPSSSAILTFSNCDIWQKTPVYHLAPPGSASCDSGDNIESSQCLAAVQSLANEKGATLGRATLQSGSGGSCLDGGWGQVPGGCSAQSGDDWAAHYKSGTPAAEGCVHTAFQLVCTGQDHHQHFDYDEDEQRGDDGPPPPPPPATKGKGKGNFFDYYEEEEEEEKDYDYWLHFRRPPPSPPPAKGKGKAKDYDYDFEWARAQRIAQAHALRIAQAHAQ